VEEPGVGKLGDLPGRSSLKKLVGFAHCLVESIRVPLGTKGIEEWAFEECRCLIAVNLTSCRSVKEIPGFSECPAIRRVMVPACVHKSGRRVFNNCAGLRDLILEEGACLDEIAGFTGSGLTSVTFPRSMRVLASAAFDDSHALSLIAVENGSAIVSIGRMSRTNLRSVHSQTVSVSVLDSFNGRVARPELS
jgi:hypothetical protein